MSPRGVMAVWNDLQPGLEDEFERWYRHQHVPERLHVPGFLEARRYVAAAGSPRYCAFYWLDSVAVLDSPAYRERLARLTAWTRRMMPAFRNMARTPARIAVDQGAGAGGVMTWLAAMDGAVACTAAREALHTVYAEASSDPACIRMQLWECDREIAARANPEAQLRTGRDTVADWIVCIETADEGSAARHAAAAAASIRARAPQAAIVAAPVYRLLWRIDAGEAPAPCADPD